LGNLRGENELKKLLLVLSVAGLLTLPTVSNAASNSSTTATTFKDVPKTHWAYSVIAAGVKKGYISGFPGNVFKPNDPVTVSQFIKMIEMSMTDKSSGFVWWGDSYLDMVPDWNKQKLNSATTGFEQGKPWYINYVTTAQNLGVIGDEYVGRYDEPLTRERAAKIINNLDSYFHGTVMREYAMIAGPQLFKDFGKADEYFQEYVGDVAIRGIMGGNKEGYFLPKATITRAEASKICVMLADAAQRSKIKVNLSSAATSKVPQAGYGNMVFVFANSEMKKTYDALAAAQSNYPGSTGNYSGVLSYYENDELRDKSFDRTYNFGSDLDNSVLHDLVISFADNTYTLSLATADGRFERASDEMHKFLSLIFTNPTKLSGVSTEIATAVKAARENQPFKSNKTFEARQVVMRSYGQYIVLGISAYKDKK
jgi:hypothetical protein